MSRYRRVLVRIWEDDKFPALHPEHQRLFLYHLTSPRSTPFLLYVEGPGAIGDALRMPTARLREGMTDLASKGMVWYSDDGSLLLCLPNALTIPENAPASPNAVKAWVALFRDLPNTPFKTKCLRHWEALGVGIGHALTDAFVKKCAMACPIQEQEQLQEQETTTTLSGLHPTSRGSQELRTHAKAVLAFLNERGGRRYRESPTNLGFILARLKSGVSVEDCRSIIARKVREWGPDPKMCKYLRPETLFNATKFESYLGELGS